MISRSVFVLTAFLAMCASTAYATPAIGWDVDILDLGPAALPVGTADCGTNGGLVTTNAGGVTPLPLDGVRQYTLYAYDGSLWDRVGITSANATAAPSKYSVAYLSGAEYKALGAAYTTFHGVAPNDGDAISQYTYSGDVNLSGSLSTDDIGVIKLNLLKVVRHQPVVEDWATGDQNFTATLTTDDIGTVKLKLLNATRFPLQYPPLDIGTGPVTGAVPSGAPAPVPEPSTIVLGILCVACFVGLRKIWK